MTPDLRTSGHPVELIHSGPVKVTMPLTGTIPSSTTAFSTTGGVTAVGVSSTGPIGYATAARGTVTQLTDATTEVVLSTLAGTITTVALTTAGAAEEAFTLTNTLILATDVIVVSTTYAGQGKPIVFVTNVTGGSCVINITNVSASALNAVCVINFAIYRTAA
jgi:hypothetical protein